MDFKRGILSTIFGSSAGGLGVIAADHALNKQNPSAQDKAVVTALAGLSAGPLGILAAQQQFKR